MWMELRRTIRSLFRSPGYSICVILILALGAGANTGALAALYELLLKPLQYPAPERIVELYETTVDRKPRGVAMANLLDWQARSQMFEAMAVYQPRTFGLTLGERGAVTVIQTGMVSPGFFETLGVPPAIGRVFSEREERQLVLSDRLWQRMFGADRGVIGRQVGLNEEPFTIVGVMPAGFEFPMQSARPEAYFALSRRDYCCGRVGSQGAVGRVREGVTLDRARAELESIAAGLAREYPAMNGGRTAGLRPLQDAMTGKRREPVWLLAGAAALLFAIACANVAGLLVARTLQRRHEFAIRRALGATTLQLVRPFLLESAALAVCGAAAGLAAARLVLMLVPKLVPTSGPVEWNASVFAAAASLAAGMTLLLGAAPAVAVLRKPRPRSWSRDGLAAAQVAFSFVLLATSAVLLQSFLRLVETSPGFSTVHAWKFGIGLPEKRYDTDRKLIAFHQELEGRLEQLPGVAGAGAAIRLPLRGGSAGGGSVFQIAGSNLPAQERPRAWINAATPGYFHAMGIPLVEGRSFTWQEDRPGEHRVAAVNESFVRMYLQGRRALGTLLDVRWVSDLNPAGSQWEVVGVVGDTRQAALDREPAPEIFLSMTQVGSEGAAYAIRARGDDPALPRAISEAVAAQDPRIERVRLQPLAGLVAESLESRDFALRLVAGFGALALLLTAAGIYGIVSQRAAERAREMAIRSALGATAPQLAGLVVLHALRLAAVGVAIGVAGFAWAAPLVRGQLYGVSEMDAASMVTVGAGVLVTALVAAVGPSRRAGRVAPIELLRER